MSGKFRLLQGPISDYDQKIINEELDDLTAQLARAEEIIRSCVWRSGVTGQLETACDKWLSEAKDKYLGRA
jgi:hypothetical protein